MIDEITEAAAAWHGSVAELEAQVIEIRATIYKLESRLRVHVAPAYLAHDASRKLLGGLLSAIDEAKARLAIGEAALANHRAMQAKVVGALSCDVADYASDRPDGQE